MSSRFLNDWKYLVMLLVTIAGAIAPLWIAKLQSTERELLINIVAQSALQPPMKEAVSDIKLMFNGKELSDPYISVLKIINDGSKPILTKDFEAPLEIHLDPKKNVIRARISAKIPEDVQAEVEWEKQVLRLKPMLLNPQDSVTVEVLTTGGSPSFVARTRIAGIGTVPVRNTEKEKPKLLTLLALALMGFLFAVASIAAMRRFSPCESLGSFTTLRNRTVAFLWLSAFGASEMIVIKLLVEFGKMSFLYTVFGMLMLFAIAFPFARMLEDRRPIGASVKQ